jgi:hypothetical protein
MSEQATERALDNERAAAFENIREALDRGETDSKALRDDAGLRSVESGMGFKPMIPAIPLEEVKFDDPPYQPDPDPTVIPVQYNQMAGPKAGEKMPEDQTVSVDQASADLTRFRSQVAEARKAAEDQELAAAFDAIIRQDAQQPADAQQHPVEQQAQPEPIVQPVTADPVPHAEVIEALRNPKVLAALDQERQQYAAQAEQARQAYEAGLAQNASLFLGAMGARHAELRGVHPSQWGAIIQSLNQTNPRRAGEILTEIEGGKNFLAQAQQAEVARQQQAQAQYQAYQQQSQRQWQTYTGAQDSEYYAFEQTRPAAEVKAVKENVLRVLSSVYNMPEADLVRAYQTNPVARSATMQRMAYDVTAQQLAREGAAAKRDRSPPTVQRPGSPQSFASREEFDSRRLNERINNTTGLDQVRAAAELVTARRNASRR